ncbi:L-lysine 6-transaminase [bacterium]|nr:L-lysine 6-transaminase [bacterium]
MIKISADAVRNTIGKHMLADGLDPIVDLKKSHGSWFVDKRDGREYLDLFSMFASMPIGYNHPYLLERSDKFRDVAINKPTNSDIYSTEMAEFVDTMARIAQPSYLSYAFYVAGGALGVENALKASFDWKVRKNIAKGNGELGSKVIHFHGCFHGRTGYTLSLTNSHDKRKTMYFPQFDWPRISTPSIQFPLNDVNLKSVQAREKQAIGEIKKAIQSNPNDIAALIIEPIQGEGGDNHFRAEFMKKLRTICDENDIIFIYDEVQTGIALTGKMWAHEHFGKEALPDMICFGKKTQVCGFFASKRIDEVENNVFHESARLNSTWGGNLVDMVRFSMYLEVIEQEKLVDKAVVNGKYLLQEINKIQSDFPKVIYNVRGKGLFCACDLESGEKRDKLRGLIQEEGAIMLGCGPKTIRFRPPVNILTEEIDYGIERIRKAIIRL